MLLLLPPSETKRPGGADGVALDFAVLSFPQLTAPRRAAVRAVRTLSRDVAAATVALKLGATQTAEVERNRSILTSPVMPSIDRYDGVLYESLDAASLTPGQRAFAARHVAIASAAFGLTMAEDPIPAYRLSHDSRLPEVSLKRLWRDPLGALLDATPGLLLDLRSEAYAALGPLPRRDDAVFVRVVSEDASGRRRALNHFNKQGKGLFVRHLIEAAEVLDSVEDLLKWARRSGVRLQPGAAGELDLLV